MPSRCALLGSLLLLGSSCGLSQALRPNSGINPSDTFVAMDMQETPNGTVQLTSPLYNPATMRR